MKYLKFLFLAIVIVCLSISFYNIFTLDRTNTDLNTKLEQTEKTYSGRIDSMTKYQEGLCAKISKLQENVSSLQTSYNNLQETYQAYVDENELKLENLKTELAEVKASLADLQANSDIDKAKIAELQTKISNLEKSIAEKNVSIEQLNSTIETQKATIAELNKTITDLTNDLNSDLSQLTFYKNLMEGTVTEITAEDLKGVTKIRDYAFYNNKVLTSVSLPNTVTLLGSNAFYNCNSLVQVDLSGYVSIGNSAFNECDKLKVFNVNGVVSSVASWAFARCSSLVSISFPFGLKEIGSCAFYQSNSFANLGIPSSITSLSSDFAQNTPFWSSLSETKGIYTCADGKLIIFKASTTIVDSDIDFSKVVYIMSLSGCANLTKAIIPNTMTYIGGGCFYGCTNLTSIVIPDNITKIYTNAFYGCTNLLNVTIMSSNVLIEKNAFGNTPFLTNLKNYNNGVYVCSDGFSIVFSVPTSVTEFDFTNVRSIAAYAFEKCTNLTSIYLPDSVKHMGAYAFSECSNLSSAIIGMEYLSNLALYQCSNLTKLILLDSFKRLDTQVAFNTNLSTIYIPSSVTFITSFANPFGGNKQTLTYYCEYDTLPIEWKGLSGCNVIFGYTRTQYNALVGITEETA